MKKMKKMKNWFGRTMIAADRKHVGDWNAAGTDAASVDDASVAGMDAGMDAGMNAGMDAGMALGEKSGFKRVSPQQQLWDELASDEQREVIATNLRYIKKRLQGELCLALVAFLRFGIRRTFGNSWQNHYLKGLIDYLQVEKEMGHFDCKRNRPASGCRAENRLRKGGDER